MEVWDVSTSNLMNTDINKNRNKLMNKLTQFTQTRDNILGVLPKGKTRSGGIKQKHICRNSR